MVTLPYSMVAGCVRQQECQQALVAATAASKKAIHLDNQL
jgi:hypothetical protein